MYVNVIGAKMRILSKLAVLEFLHKNKTKKYPCWKIAEVFAVKSADMLPILIMLGDKIEIRKESRSVLYFYNDLEIKKIEEPVIKPFKVYKQPSAMGERCKELYPDGGNFVSVC